MGAGGVSNARGLAGVAAGADRTGGAWSGMTRGAAGSTWMSGAENGVGVAAGTGVCVGCAMVGVVAGVATSWA